MTTDYALAVELVDGPGVKFGNGSSWENLVATYTDQNIPIKAQAVYDAAYATWLAQRTNDSPVQTYLDSHFAQRRTILKALYVFEVNGVNAHTTAGTNLDVDYKNACTLALNVINTLPQAYIDNLNKERDLLGLTTAISQMSLVQVRNFAVFLRGWLNTRAVMITAGYLFNSGV